MKQSKNILFCILNWGLGHASRCIPIIKNELKNGNKVFIAGSGLSLQFLKKEFKEGIKFFELTNYNINYGKGNFFVFGMMLQIPKILFSIFKEHQQTKKIVTQNNITEIYSDSRFGCFNKNVFTKFLTHQLYIKLPKPIKFLEHTLAKVNFYFINKYNQCLIIDEENSLLSGELSNFKNRKLKPKCNIKYIGALSRMVLQTNNCSVISASLNIKKENSINNSASLNITDDSILVLLSGPEPQRTILEQKIVSSYQKEKKDFKIILVRGTNIKAKTNFPDAFEVINLANTATVYFLLNKCQKIICRSGYSTILDLFKLNKKAILIPTPKQTEQIYLAKHLSLHFGFTSIEQQNFNFKKVKW